ncbi:hypothetical protein G210_1037 [Candida maltosa Xu316]|uniref:F-box domain-containing protein n=1 Tax=Candida maltosa (strain Xu316) TaxID=1245528 RepID=M3J8G5_CANMX|nr:hypothetical protein G210_1037 [Candida maltosa Xu316]
MSDFEALVRGFINQPLEIILRILFYLPSCSWWYFVELDSLRPYLLPFILKKVCVERDFHEDEDDQPLKKRYDFCYHMYSDFDTLSDLELFVEKYGMYPKELEFGFFVDHYIHVCSQPDRDIEYMFLDRVNEYEDLLTKTEMIHFLDIFEVDDSSLEPLKELCGRFNKIGTFKIQCEHIEIHELAEYLSILPTTLKCLNVYSSEIAAFDGFLKFSNLTDLVVDFVDIKIFQFLPETIKSLEVYTFIDDDDTEVASLDRYPSYLKKLTTRLKDRRILHKVGDLLPKLPKLKSIEIISDILTNVDDLNLPDTIRELKFERCPSLTNYSCLSKLPNLTDLVVGRCPYPYDLFTEDNNDSLKLRWFEYAGNADAVTELRNIKFPGSLKTLILSCSIIIGDWELPKNLQVLRFRKVSIEGGFYIKLPWTLQRVTLTKTNIRKLEEIDIEFATGLQLLDVELNDGLVGAERSTWRFPRSVDILYDYKDEYDSDHLYYYR